MTQNRLALQPREAAFVAHRGFLAALAATLVFVVGLLALPVAARADVEAVKGKTFKVATDTTFAPFEYRNDDGELVGIDMDLIRAIAEQEGFDVTIDSMGFNAAMLAVDSGNADMAIAGASITDERKLKYDFSDPYFDSGVQMAVLANSPITGYEDLKGKTVVVKTGTEGEAFAKSIQEKYGFDIKTVNETAMMSQMVSAGQADALFDDYPIVAYGITQGSGLKVVTDKEQGSSYGAVVKKGQNQDLLEAFDEGLAKLKADGTYDKIMATYLGETKTGGVNTTGAASEQEAIALVAKEMNISEDRVKEALEAVKGKTFKVATDTTFAPFEYRDEKGEMAGIDMDLVRAVAQKMGFKVDIDSMGFNAAMLAVDSGNADMAIAGASITDERKLKYDFTDPYFDSGVQMAVAEGSPVSGYDDLKGKTVVVKTGTEGEAFAKSIQEKYGFDIKTVNETAMMSQMVSAGQADALFDDYPIVAYGITQGSGLKVVTDKEQGSSYGAVVKKDKNQDLLIAFNVGFAELVGDGTYDKILTTYLGEAKDAAQGAAQEELGFVALLQKSAPALLEGVKNTLLVTVVAFAGALVLGVLFGLMKITHNKVLRAVAALYVWLFRGTPLLIWAFFFYFALPQLFGIKLSVFAVGALALALNAGSYITEIVRGAIQSVDPGQTEAARCLGCSAGLTMRSIVLPQAAKIATPSLINQLIIMVKDSSILLAIGFGELLYQAQQIYAANYRIAEVLFIVAVFYLITISLLTMLANWATRRFSE